MMIDFDFDLQQIKHFKILFRNFQQRLLV